jgi:hypothetical protein
MIRLLMIMIVTAVAGATGYAQTGGKIDNPGEVEILFANGSLVRMTMIQEKIDILTPYGKLNVPLKDIRRIEFGLHVPEGMDKKVDAAIKQLASADFKEREAAVRELVTLGVYAYPALLQAAKSAELEVAKRATDAVARIRAKVPAKELRLGEEDRVVTRTFTIVGHIVTPALKARTEYFGEAQLSLAQLRTLRVLVESKDADVAVDAAKYAVANEWLETNVTVDGNSVLTIAATGQVDLLPRQPGMVVCGPQGYGAGAPGAFGGPGGFAGPGKKVGKGGMAARAYSGVLLGRIGENGDIFVIGERYEGAPERDGKLYLHINPSQYDAASTGAYQVRISTRY